MIDYKYEKTMDKFDVIQVQNALIVGCFIGMSGQRRQIITELLCDGIKYDKESNNYYAELGPEKVERKDNAEGISIPIEIGYSITFFIKYLRKYLKPKNVDSIWVNDHGNPLEFKEVTKRVKKFMSTEIFPDQGKVITPITFRRIIITSVFKNKISHEKQTMSDFINDLATYLNTSTLIMEQYYRRNVDKERNVSTMNIIHKKLLTSSITDNLRDNILNNNNKIEINDIEDESEIEDDYFDDDNNEINIIYDESDNNESSSSNENEDNFENYNNK